METKNFNTELEMSLLGGIMAHPKYFDDYDVRGEDFYDHRHEKLFDVLSQEVRAGNPVTPDVLASKVTNIPGMTFQVLLGMFEVAPSSGVTVIAHASTVAGLARKRRVEADLRASLEKIGLAPWDEVDVPLDELRARLDKAAEQISTVEVVDFSELYEEAFAEWQKPLDENLIRTGWVTLDDYLNGGFRPGQLTILGARPAVGKSAIASCLAVANHEQGVGFFSLEMPNLELVNRMASIETGVELSRLTRHDLREYEWKKLDAFRRSLPGWKVFMEDRPQRSISQIRASLRSWKRKGEVRLVIVDYLQLMAPADRTEQRERQVSRISEDLKAMAKDFGVAVVALAQVNRGAALSDNKRPTMAHLRESGGIEANADQVLLLHRDENAPHVIEVIVAKNRHGSVGTVQLVWSPAVSSAYEERPHSASYPFGRGLGY